MQVCSLLCDFRAMPPKKKRSSGQRELKKYAGWIAIIAVVILAFFLAQPKETAEQSSDTAPPKPSTNVGAESIATESTDDPGDALISHLKNKGGTMAYRLQSFPGGLRGVVGDRPLKAGYKIMDIPLDELLFDETVAPEVRSACEMLPCNMSRAVLALGIAYEKSLGSGSRFAPFIRTLPEEVTNFVAWPGPLLDLISIAMPGTQGYLSRELQELKGANKLLPSPVSDKELIWAIAMVQTRAFGTWSGGEALIPGATFFNHNWDPQKAIPMPKCDTGKRRCQLHTNQAIPLGSQIYFHYRPWSNLQLLIRYGFAAPGNPWGPEVKFEPLADPPTWLVEDGCRAGGLLLRDESGPDGLSLSLEKIRCAQAAFVASTAEGGSEATRGLWKSGAFNTTRQSVPISSTACAALRSMSDACKAHAQRYIGDEGVRIITAVGALSTAISGEVIRSLQHELKLLMVCEASLGEQASKCDADIAGAASS